MSEEEIIKIIDNLVLLPTDWAITKNYDGKLDFIGSLEANEAIQGLLDLYNKEKEKNKNLLLQLKDSEKELLEVTKNIINKEENLLEE